MSEEPMVARDAVTVYPPSPRKLFLALAAITLAFFVISVMAVAIDDPGTLTTRFDTAHEANLPTWFATVLWFAAGALAILIGAAGRQRGSAAAPGWTLVGVIFVLASVNEAGQLHEQTVGPLMTGVQDLLGIDKPTARLVAVAVVGVLLGFVALRLLPWLHTLPLWLGLRLAAAGTIFISGALILEVASRLSDGSTIALYMSPLEECLEMFGTSLLVVTLVAALRSVMVHPDPPRTAQAHPA